VTTRSAGSRSADPERGVGAGELLPGWGGGAAELEVRGDQLGRQGVGALELADEGIGAELAELGAWGAGPRVRGHVVHV
jgi:hypothetical protein